MSWLKEEYGKKVVSELMDRFGYRNLLEVPKLVKIVVSMGINSSEDKKEALGEAEKIIAAVTGQKAATTKAKKSISGFRLRQGDLVGCRVTLRGRRMYEFLERLVNAAIPRIRDFRGLSVDSFDGRGNYSVGIEESLIFPELASDEGKGARGMNVTVVTTAATDEEGVELLRMLGMPFGDGEGGKR